MIRRRSCSARHCRLQPRCFLTTHATTASPESPPPFHRIATTGNTRRNKNKDPLGPLAAKLERWFAWYGL